MSLSNSRLSYTDCFKLLDKAMDEARGIRVEVQDGDAANYLRMRIHHARQIDRKENVVVYPDTGHYLHGRSIYDEIVCRIENLDDRVFLYLDKQKVDILGVEPIPEGYAIAAPEPVLMIEGPKVEATTDMTVLAQAHPQPSLRRR